MAELNILTTHVDPLPETPAHDINALLPGEEQAELLRLSILKLAPNAKFHFIHKRIHDTPNQQNLGANPKLHAQLTLNILRLQRDYLQSESGNADWIVCDPDFLFFKNPHPVFNQEFEIAITKRENKIMPYNSGIIFLKNRERNTAANFFNEKIRIIENFFSDYSNWFGDQLVLNEIIRKSKCKEENKKYIYKNILIKVLDGSEYNYSPHRDHPYLFLTPKVTAYHFKGRCRPYMKEYFRAYISESDPIAVRKIRKYVQSVRLEHQRGVLKELFLSAKERVIPDKF